MIRKEELNLVTEWDKTFKKSDKVDHSKVTFVTVHTDLYDGGDKDYIPYDKLESFFKENLK